VVDIRKDILPGFPDARRRICQAALNEKDKLRAATPSVIIPEDFSWFE
jgi:hypothetical protein